MNANTLGQIMSAATRRAGRRSDLDISTVSGYVNQAYLEVAESVPHALLESITTYSLSSGSYNGTLPADFNEPIAFLFRYNSTDSSTVSSQHTLQRIRESDGMVQDRDDIGLPTEIVFHNDAFEIYPRSAYTADLGLRYRAYPSVMTETSSVPSISTPWRWAIVLRTEALLHEDLGNDAAAGIAQNRYLSSANTRKSDEARRAASEMRHYVRPLWNTTQRRS